MCSNFLLSAIMQDFHYLSLSATGCVGIAYNCSQYVDSSLGLTGQTHSDSSEGQPLN